MLAIIGCFDDVLIELGSVFELGPDALDALFLAQIKLDPGWSGGTGAPECAVVVIHRIFRTEIVVVIRRGAYLGSEGEVLGNLHFRLEVDAFVGWNHFLDGSVGVEFQLVYCHLSVEATVGMRVVVAMINDVVVVAFLQHAVVTWSVHGSVGIGLEDGAVVGVGTHRMLSCGVIHAVAGILAVFAGVEEIVDAVALEDERSLEEVFHFGVLDELGFAERFHIRIQFACSAAEAWINAPGAPIHIY